MPSGSRSTPTCAADGCRCWTGWRFGRGLKGPVGFLYPKDDPKPFAKRALEAITRGKKDLKWTAARAVSDTGLVGDGPRRTSEDTEKMLRRYVAGVLEDHAGAGWEPRDGPGGVRLGLPRPGRPDGEAAREKRLRLVPLQGLGIR